MTNNAELVNIFDFSDLETGTYMINASIYADVNSGQNCFAFFNSTENKSSTYRMYFIGYPGYTVAQGYCVVEHVKGQNCILQINNYRGSAVNVSKTITTAVAMKLK